MAELALKVALQVELGVERLRGRRMHGALDGGQRASGLLGQVVGHRLHLGHQDLGIVIDAPDQPPGQRGPGVELLAQHRQPHCPRHADALRHEPRAARVRQQPDLDEGLQEAGVFRGQHDVAGQRQVGTRAGRHAVDRGNHRQRQGAQSAHQRVELLVDERTQVRHLPGCHIELGEILPRAEATPGAGQDQCASPLPLHLVQGLAQFPVHAGGEAVELVGTVQRDGGHAIMPVEQNGRAGHLVSSSVAG